MKELLYFSSSDLMVQVTYNEDINSINYFSHRELSFGERVVVEQYLLTNVAIKTEYYKKHPALLHYNGINSGLVKDLNQFHLKATMSTLKDKEEKVADSVKSLIDKSLSAYYFEQIGTTILEIRQAVNSPRQKHRLFQFGSKLRELVDAYNFHSAHKVEFDKIVPVELKTYIV